MTTDPVADMLTRIRNASRAKHPRVMQFEIVEQALRVALEVRRCEFG